MCSPKFHQDIGLPSNTALYACVLIMLPLEIVHHQLIYIFSGLTPSNGRLRDSVSHYILKVNKILKIIAKSCPNVAMQ